MLRNQAPHSFQLIAGCALALLAGLAQAAPQPIRDLPLQAMGEQRWRLPAGEYAGQFRIDESLQLICEPGAVLDAQGQGNVLTIAASDVQVEGCTLRNWGRDLTAMDSAVFILPEAERAAIRNNRMQGPGFGVFLDRAVQAEVSGNRIDGDASVRSQDRGNGIHLFAVKGARILGNQVRDVRDGIYIDTSHGNHMEGNLIEDVRYGVHYMFANENSLIDNITRRTRTG
ncbi:MAG: copper-binding protein, partial [Stutzerimonas stutzeri]